MLNLFSRGTGDDRNGYIRDVTRVKPKANDPIAVKEKFIHAKVCLVDYENNSMTLFRFHVFCTTFLTAAIVEINLSGSHLYAYSCFFPFSVQLKVLLFKLQKLFL